MFDRAGVRDWKRPLGSVRLGSVHRSTVLEPSGGYQHSRGGFQQRGGYRQNEKGTFREKRTLLCHTSRSPATGKISKRSSCSKKVILCKDSTGTTFRQTGVFPGKLEITYSRRSNSPDRPGDPRYDRERCNSEGCSQGRSIHKQSISSG